MTGDASINLRVSRLENDVQSIYELVADILSTQQEHTRRFETLETTMSSRFESLETTMNSRFETFETTMSSRFETLETTMSSRFETVGTVLDEIVRRLPEPS